MEETTLPREIRHEPSNRPAIDVVIPAHEKDADLLDASIAGVRNCLRDPVRRVIVVSARRYTANAEWVPETAFPFGSDEIRQAVRMRHPSESDPAPAKWRGENYPARAIRHTGWLLQQLIKLYCFRCIPELSDNVLILDSDTVFLNPHDVFRYREDLGQWLPLYLLDQHTPVAEAYRTHFEKLLPDLPAVGENPVVHHMVFQRRHMESLFAAVEKRHDKVFWEAYLGSSELFYDKPADYYSYYSFLRGEHLPLLTTQFPWVQSGDIEKLERFREQGYRFASFHSYKREKFRRARRWRPGWRISRASRSALSTRPARRSADVE